MFEVHIRNSLDGQLVFVQIKGDRQELASIKHDSSPSHDQLQSVGPLMTKSDLNNIENYTGFVRIAPSQLLSIPVCSKQCFITVYVEDMTSERLICLANQ